ncbi:MAG: Si-specific NAD(P)(+) transhydrogenase [Planctomycetota bacterium]|jgi:NAD(P) transhydrogenase
MSNSSDFDYDLICIGSGPAGQRCAVQASKLGKRVALIEKQPIIGGVCLETGTIPSKTFREAVRNFDNAQNFDDGLGFAPRTKPTLQHLLGRVSNVIERETRVQRHQLQKNDINVILGKASFVDTNTVMVEANGDSRLLSAERFMIAAGTRPAQPPGVVADEKTIITSDGVRGLDHLPQTLTVVGAGVIGIEYASMFASLGVEVTVIDKYKNILPFLDREIVDELMYQMRQMEVTFRLGESVENVSVIDGPRPEGMIELESGKHIVSELVLYSAGRQGNADLLNLEAAGLAPIDRGRIEVDEHYRTSAPHIYAAGDIIGFPSLAATSAEQGRLAALHMGGIEGGPMPTHFPFGIYAIPEISMVGQTEEQLTEEKTPYEVGIARYREIARGQILGDDTGLFKMIFHRETRKLLGVHAIGTGSTELIHIGQAVLGLGGGLDYFLETIFNYPTFAECYKVAALNCANKLKRLTRAANPCQETQAETAEV